MAENATEPSYVAKQRLNARIIALEAEIGSVDADIQRLQALRQNLLEEKLGVQRELDGHSSRPQLANGSGSSTAKGKSKLIDYFEEFEWTRGLKDKMKKVFDINNFRLCQEGVCNANMDGRDIVCVMPTGGGKSLTYQLPALLNPGCTLVISPLISLITDQILHLRDADVEAVMLTGTTGKEETRDIMNRLNPVKKMGGKEIKLCYVTPEKIAKSKTFMSVLEKMANAGKLARIVIDEAHCVSQIGHDFRPDYKKLSILRQLFPRVPIMALSATCPPRVLKDLLQILRLKEVTDGKGANFDGTVYFTAPLYRKNLHYKVVPKPSSTAGVIQAMGNYILQHHKGDSGIVYCLSKKDTQTVADGLRDVSEGKIKTGVYHSDCAAAEKERLHKDWREGSIKVVCATIAFGLGIDKGDVRFVLHHSMSKSLDGFYQESGRAGRDGGDADCILYFRPQDASRMSALICSELEGQEKLHSMLKFAQNVTECRKLLFANYFSSSSSIALSAWSADASDNLTRCGHCDNCKREPDSLEKKDVTLDAWKILRVLQTIQGEGGQVTIGMLSDLVRGAGGAAFSVAQQGNGRKRKSLSKEKVGLDLDATVGGKVSLGKDDTETLVVELLLKGYLKEEFSTTAYTINVYVAPGPQSVRLTRLPKEAIEAGAGTLIEHHFPKSKKAAAKSGSSKKKPAAAATAEKGPLPTFVHGEWPPKRHKSSSSRIFDEPPSAEDSEEDMPLFHEDSSTANMDDTFAEGSTMLNDTEVIELSDDDEPPHRKTFSPPKKKSRPSDLGKILVPSSDSDDSYPSGDENGFTFVLNKSRRTTTPPPKAKPVAVIDISP